MREFTFGLTYDEGASDLMDLFAEYQDLRARSEACFATSENMWRVDRLSGPRERLDELEEQFLDTEKCNECLETEDCDTERTYDVMQRTPTTRLVYTRRSEIHGCHSIPYLAADELGDGAVFEARRAGRTYTWRVLMPSAENAGALYDRLEGTYDGGVQLDLKHFSEPKGWTGSLTALDRLSPEQREALELAVEAGYYGTPKGVTLEDLAADAGVPRSTFQYRLRSAEATVLEDTVDSAL